MKRLKSTIGTVIVSAALVVGIGSTPAQAVTVSMNTLLNELPITAEYTGKYDRALFPHWFDADGDGCDTRREVLIAESIVKPTVSSSCSVRGKWKSYFDGKVWTNPADVDIDHMVALSEAWDSGAQKWNSTKLRAFANDLFYSWSLGNMTDNMNSSKGDRDPAQWLPPTNKCTYLKAWIGVKYRWGLSVDSAEKSAISNFAKSFCGASTTMTKPPRWVG